MESGSTQKVITPDGDMEIFLSAPTRPKPGLVLVYMDVWGIRDELCDIARAIARRGYLCLLPDLYYREGRVRHRFADSHGRMPSLASLTPAEQEAVRGPMRRLTDGMAMSDTRAIIDHFGAQSERVAAIGYCMGGRHALIAAGVFGKVVRAAACLHGSLLVNDRPDSPHLVAARATGETYCGFAERDPFAAADVIAGIERSFASTGASFAYKLHRDAYHGYALPDRDVYDPRATAQDWEQIDTMLASALVA